MHMATAAGLLLLLAPLPACGGDRALPAQAAPPAANAADAAAAGWQAVGRGPSGVALADLDGDGDLDLVTDSWEEDRLLLLANDGRGGFPGPAVPLAVGDHPYANALAADVGGDGRADLVAPNLRGGSVSVLLAGGEGRFAPAPGSPFAAGPSPFWVALGDVTGDRRPDLVVANYGGGLDDRSDDGLYVAPGVGIDRFGAPVRLPACWGPTRVELADLDGDGPLDAAVACLGDHEVRFFRGGASGLAAAAWPAVPVGGGPGGIALGDVDGDGRPDLVASDGPGARVLLRRSPAGPGPATGGAGTLLVGNKADATVSLLDLPSGKVVATLPTGEGPHELAVSPDGKTALVADYGTGPRPGRTLTVIDVAAAKVAKTIDLGAPRRPHGLAWLDGRRALVTAEASQALLVVDVDAGKVVQEITTGQEVSHMVAVAPGGRRAFVANIGSGTMTALDLAAGKKLADVKTGAGAEGIDVSPDGRWVWVTNREAGTVTVVDAESLEVAATVEVPGFPIRAKATPDGKRVLVSAARAGDLAVLAAAERTLERRVDFGLRAAVTEGRLLGAFGSSSVPIGIVVAPDGRRAYVAHANADKIAVLDLASWKVTGTFTAGKEPDGMAYSPLTATIGR